MTTTRTDRLQAKCNARNRVHQELLDRTGAMIDALTPFIGQRVRIATGQIAEKVKRALPALPSTVPLTGWYTCSNYGLRVELKTCEPSGEYACCYAEISFTLADIENGILKSVNSAAEAKHFRTDYTPFEIETLREELRKAEDESSRIELKLYHFGKYDN